MEHSLAEGDSPVEGNSPAEVHSPAEENGSLEGDSSAEGEQEHWPYSNQREGENFMVIFFRNEKFKRNEDYVLEEKNLVSSKIKTNTARNLITI